MTDGQIIVLVASSKTEVRGALRSLLASYEFVRIAGESTGPAELPSLVARLNPHVVFLDTAFGGLDAARASSDSPESRRPLVVYTSGNGAWAARAFAAGALDYLVHPIDEERFRSTMDRAMAQLRVFPPSRFRRADAERAPQETWRADGT